MQYYRLLQSTIEATRSKKQQKRGLWTFSFLVIQKIFKKII